ncbi:hypothetical protein DFH09DRAFT_1082264 [Mycena vulgaris]|nr:hypothetical protein DFH09DRAFT_1082264 [Mycena vulgaris]
MALSQAQVGLAWRIRDHACISCVRDIALSDGKPCSNRGLISAISLRVNIWGSALESNSESLLRILARIAPWHRLVTVDLFQGERVTGKDSEAGVVRIPKQAWETGGSVMAAFRRGFRWNWFCLIQVEPP